MAICHSGDCPQADECRKKVKVSCECKTRRIDATCDQVRGGLLVAACDSVCAEKRAAAETVAAETARQQQLLQEEKDRQELLEYEKKFGPRKYKERKQQVIEEQTGYSLRILVVLSSALVVAAVGVALYMDLF